MVNKFDRHGKVLKFKFASQEAANHFKHWLCGAGEQDYWTWMECRELEEPGAITGLEFDYHSGNDEIPVRCGRLKPEPDDE